MGHGAGHISHPAELGTLGSATTSGSSLDSEALSCRSCFIVTGLSRGDTPCSVGPGSDFTSTWTLSERGSEDEMTTGSSLNSVFTISLFICMGLGRRDSFLRFEASLTDVTTSDTVFDALSLLQSSSSSSLTVIVSGTLGLLGGRPCLSCCCISSWCCM